MAGRVFEVNFRISGELAKGFGGAMKAAQSQMSAFAAAAKASASAAAAGVNELTSKIAKLEHLSVDAAKFKQLQTNLQSAQLEALERSRSAAVDKQAQTQSEDRIAALQRQVAQLRSERDSRTSRGYSAEHKLLNQQISDLNAQAKAEKERLKTLKAVAKMSQADAVKQSKGVSDLLAQVQKLQGKLNLSGFDTSNYFSSWQKLRGEIDETTRALERQKQVLQNEQGTLERVQKAQAELSANAKARQEEVSTAGAIDLKVRKAQISDTVLGVAAQVRAQEAQNMMRHAAMTALPAAKETGVDAWRVQDFQTRLSQRAKRITELAPKNYKPIELTAPDELGRLKQAQALWEQYQNLVHASRQLRGEWHAASADTNRLGKSLREEQKRAGDLKWRLDELQKIQKDYGKNLSDLQRLDLVRAIERVSNAYNQALQNIKKLGTGLDASKAQWNSIKAALQAQNVAARQMQTSFGKAGLDTNVLSSPEMQAMLERVGSLSPQTRDQLAAAAKKTAATDIKVRQAHSRENILGIAAQVRSKEASDAMARISGDIPQLLERQRAYSQQAQELQWKVPRRGQLLAEQLSSPKSYKPVEITAADEIGRFNQARALWTQQQELINSSAEWRKERRAATTDMVALGRLYQAQQQHVSQLGDRINALKDIQKSYGKYLSEQQSAELSRYIGELSAAHSHAQQILKDTGASFETSKAQWRNIKAALQTQKGAMLGMQASLKTSGFDERVLADPRQYTLGRTTAANTLAQHARAALDAGQAQAQEIQSRIAQRAQLISGTPSPKSYQPTPITAADETGRFNQARALWTQQQELINSSAKLREEWQKSSADTLKIEGAYNQQQLQVSRLSEQLERLKALQKGHGQYLSPQESADLARQINELSTVYSQAQRTLKATGASFDTSRAQWDTIKETLRAQSDAASRMQTLLNVSGISRDALANPQQHALASIGLVQSNAAQIRKSFEAKRARAQGVQENVNRRARLVSELPKSYTPAKITAADETGRFNQARALWEQYQQLVTASQKLRGEWQATNADTARLAKTYQQQQQQVAQLASQLERLKNIQKGLGQYLSPQQAVGLASNINEISAAYNKAQQVLKATGASFETSKVQGGNIKRALQAQQTAATQIQTTLNTSGFSRQILATPSLHVTPKLGSVYTEVARSAAKLNVERAQLPNLQSQVYQRSKFMSPKSYKPVEITETENAKRLKQLQAAYEQYQKLASLYKQLSAEQKKASATTVGLGKSYKQQQAAVKSLGEQLERLKNLQKNYGQYLSVPQAAGLAANISEISAAYSKAQQNLKATGTNLDTSKAQWHGINEALRAQSTAARQIQTALNAAGLNVSSFAASESRLRAEIESTTRALERQQKAAERQTKFNEARSGFSNEYNNFLNDWQNMQTVMAPFSSSVTVAKDFEAQMSVVKSLTQMDNLREGNIERANAEMKALEGQAEHLGMTTKFTALQAAQGQTYLAYAGWTPKQILSAMPSTLNLATAANMTDLGRVADIYTDIMMAFKLPAEEAERVADVLTYTFTHSNQNLEDLYQTMSYAGPIAPLFGSSLEETAAITKFMADSGIKGSRAGTAIRSVMTRLVAPPKAAYEAMSEHGISVGDATKEWMDAQEIAKSYGIELKTGLTAGKQMASVVRQINENMGDLSSQEKLGVFKAITGMYALSGAANLFETGGELVDDEQNPGQKITRLEAFTRRLETSQGSAAQTSAVQLDNYAGAVVIMNSTIEALQTQVGQTLIPALRAAAEAVTPLIARLAEWVDENPMIVQGLAAIAAAFTGVVIAGAGVAVLSKAWAVVTSGLGIAGDVAAKVLGTFVGLGARVPAAFLSWHALFAVIGMKIGAVFTSIGAKLGALMTFVRGLTFASIAAGVQSLGVALVGLGAKVLHAVKAFSLLAISPAGVALMALAAIAVAVYQNWDKVGPVLEHVAGVLGGSLSAAFQTVQPAISSAIAAFEHLFEVIGNDTSGELLSKTIIVAVNAIVGALATMVDFAANAFAALADIVAGGVDIVAHVADGDWAGAWESAKKHASEFEGHAAEAVTAIPRGIESTYKNTQKSLEIYNERERNLPEEQRKAEAVAYGKELQHQQVLSLQRQGIDTEEFFKQRREEAQLRAKMSAAGYGHFDENLQWHGDKEGYAQHEKDVEAEYFQRFEQRQAEVLQEAQARGVAPSKHWDKDIQRWVYSLPDLPGVKAKETALFRGRTEKVTGSDGGDAKDKNGNVKYVDRHALTPADLKALEEAQSTAAKINIPQPEAVENSALPTQHEWAKIQADAYKKAEAWQKTPVPVRAAAESHSVPQEQLKIEPLKFDVYKPTTQMSYTPGQSAGLDTTVKSTPPPAPQKIETPPPQQEASLGGSITAALASVFSPLLAVLQGTSSTAAAATPERASQIDTSNVQLQLDSLGAAASTNATSLTTNAQNFTAVSTNANQSLSAILNSSEAFGQHLMSIANSTATANENISAVQAPAQETAISLEQSASSIQTVNETFSLATQAISESVSQISVTYSEALATAGTSIAEASTLIVTSTALVNESIAQAGATVLTFNTEVQSLAAAFAANNSAVQQSTAAFAADTAAVQQNSAAAQASAGSLIALSGAAQGAVGGVLVLGSSSAGAAGSVSMLGAAAANAVATMNSAASSIASAAASAQAAAASASAAASSVSAPAQNYKGGIYNKGAFLTWFAEKSPEAAIPLDGSDRAINLWQQTGAMLGVYPYETPEFQTAPNLIPAENYKGGIYAPGGRSLFNSAKTFSTRTNTVAQTYSFTQPTYNFSESQGLLRDTFTKFETGTANLFSASTNLQSASTTIQKTERKNFIEKGAEAVNNFFYRIFHPRKWKRQQEIKRRGYETDELGNIIGLNGLDDNFITGKETKQVQRAKREAQQREWREVRERLDRGEEFPPIVSEHAAFEEIPEPTPSAQTQQKIAKQQPKAADWVLNPRPTFG